MFVGQGTTEPEWSAEYLSNGSGLLVLFSVEVTYGVYTGILGHCTHAASSLPMESFGSARTERDNRIGVFGLGKNREKKTETVLW